MVSMSSMPGRASSDDLLTSAGDRFRSYLGSRSARGWGAPDAYPRLCPFGEEAAHQATTLLLERIADPTGAVGGRVLLAEVHLPRVDWPNPI